MNISVNYYCIKTFLVYLCFLINLLFSANVESTKISRYGSKNSGTLDCFFLLLYIYSLVYAGF